MDLAKVEQELLCVAKDMIKDHPDIRSIVLECTDLPPYAHRLQQELKLPVFDIITLANMVHDIAVRRPFTGFMPY
jgi:Asp/Glu/hydantoin racemase